MFVDTYLGVTVHAPVGNMSGGFENAGLILSELVSTLHLPCVGVLEKNICLKKYLLCL